MTATMHRRLKPVCQFLFVLMDGRANTLKPTQPHMRVLPCARPAKTDRGTARTTISNPVFSKRTVSFRIPRSTRGKYCSVNEPGLTIRDTLATTIVTRVVRRSLNRQYANMIASAFSGSVEKGILVRIGCCRVSLAEKDFVFFILN